jgi:hypothetical protein
LCVSQIFIVYYRSAYLPHLRVLAGTLHAEAMAKVTLGLGLVGRSC